MGQNLLGLDEKSITLVLQLCFQNRSGIHESGLGLESPYELRHQSRQRSAGF